MAITGITSTEGGDGWFSFIHPKCRPHLVSHAKPDHTLNQVIHEPRRCISTGQVVTTFKPLSSLDTPQHISNLTVPCKCPAHTRAEFTCSNHTRHLHTYQLGPLQMVPQSLCDLQEGGHQYRSTITVLQDQRKQM